MLVTISRNVNQAITIRLLIIKALSFIKIFSFIITYAFTLIVIILLKTFVISLLLLSLIIKALIIKTLSTIKTFSIIITLLKPFATSFITLKLRRNKRLLLFSF